MMGAYTQTGEDMSGFGLRAFKKVSDDEKRKESFKYYKHIVYGENTFGVLTFIRLNQKYPGQVKYITNNPFFKEELLNEWNCTLNSIRSAEVADALTSMNPRFEILKSGEDVLFYKDTKLHKFGGRAKSHDLKEEETFFTEPAYQFKPQAMFDFESFDKLDETLKEHQLHKIIAEIELTDPSDLADPCYYKLHTGEFESYGCENLYFCESPKKFLSLVSNKEKLDDALYAFSAGISSDQAIAVHIKCDREVMKETGTVILPQSMTHDWGSFVLDIEAYDPETNTQEFKALTFIGENDIQEEDLAKKIKLMKRVIERVFPELQKANTEQSIKFNEEYRITGTNDGQYDELQNKTVKFLGQGAPLNHAASSSFQYMSRGIYAILNADL